jgi:hypothetical protein
LLSTTKVGDVLLGDVLYPALLQHRPGAAYVSKVAKDTRALGDQTPACGEGYVSLYRAVGTIEHVEIGAIQRYMLVPGGLTRKDFFFDLSNAQWIAEFNRRLEATPTKEVFIVTSKVCPTTIAMGENFTDANKPAIAFDAAALKFVNLDASRSGGITTVWTTGPVK